MEISDALYRRKFTQWAHMQKACELIYAIVYESGENAKYGVSITKCTKQTTQVQAVKGITQSRAAAERILLFLYENAVTPQVLPDIMSDIVAENTVYDDEAGDTANG